MSSSTEPAIKALVMTSDRAGKTDRIHRADGREDKSAQIGGRFHAFTAFFFSIWLSGL